MLNVEYIYAHLYNTSLHRYFSKKRMPYIHTYIHTIQLYTSSRGPNIFTIMNKPTFPRFSDDYTSSVWWARYSSRGLNDMRNQTGFFSSLKKSSETERQTMFYFKAVPKHSLNSTASPVQVQSKEEKKLKIRWYEVYKDVKVQSVQTNDKGHTIMCWKQVWTEEITSDFDKTAKKSAALRSVVHGGLWIGLSLAWQWMVDPKLRRTGLYKPLLKRWLIT